MSYRTDGVLPKGLGTVSLGDDLGLDLSKNKKKEKGGQDGGHVIVEAPEVAHPAKQERPQKTDFQNGIAATSGQTIHSWVQKRTSDVRLDRAKFNSAVGNMKQRAEKPAAEGRFSKIVSGAKRWVRKLLPDIEFHAAKPGAHTADIVQDLYGSNIDASADYDLAAATRGTALISSFFVLQTNPDLVPATIRAMERKYGADELKRLFPNEKALRRHVYMSLMGEISKQIIADAGAYGGLVTLPKPAFHEMMTLATRESLERQDIAEAFPILSGALGEKRVAGLHRRLRAAYANFQKEPMWTSIVAQSEQAVGVEPVQIMSAKQAVSSGPVAGDPPLASGIEAAQASTADLVISQAQLPSTGFNPFGEALGFLGLAGLGVGGFSDDLGFKMAMLEQLDKLEAASDHQIVINDVLVDPDAKDRDSLRQDVADAARKERELHQVKEEAKAHAKDSVEFSEQVAEINEQDREIKQHNARLENEDEDREDLGKPRLGSFNS